MTEEFNPQDYKINPDDFNKFVSTLREEEKDEIDRIITRYINYEPAMVEAALHVAVDRGIMSYDAKGGLLKQIRFNFSKKAKAAKQANWESHNAFTGYVAGYTDDEIYSLIEDPADIVIDVYHAILITAVERELITQEEFERTYTGTLNSAGNDEDVFRDILTWKHEYLRSGDMRAEKEEDKTDYIPRTSRFSPGRYLLSRLSIVFIVIGGVLLFSYFKNDSGSSGVSEFEPVVGLIALLTGLIIGFFYIRSIKSNENN